MIVKIPSTYTVKSGLSLSQALLLVKQLNAQVSSVKYFHDMAGLAWCVRGVIDELRGKKLEVTLPDA